MSDDENWHACRDLANAREKGSFEVETPRGHVDSDDIEHGSIGVTRDTRRRGTEYLVGPWKLSIELELRGEQPLWLAVEDLFNEAKQEHDVCAVCYGELHLWQMGDPYHENIEYEYTADPEGEVEATLELVYRDVEAIAWR